MRLSRWISSLGLLSVMVLSDACAPAKDWTSPEYIADRVKEGDERAFAELTRLTPEQQRCIQCVGIEGLSYEETATIEQVPVGTIKSRVVRGRQMLRALLDQTNIVPATGTASRTLSVDSSPRYEPSRVDDEHSKQIELLRRWRAERAAARCAIG